MSAVKDLISKDPKQVEEQLKRICKRLNDTEVNIDLLKRMVKKGVETNDVKNFVAKQSDFLKKPSGVFGGKN